MGSTMRKAWALMALAAGPAAAQGDAARFAVLPFENGGSYGQDKEVFEALELGVPALLARALDRYPGAGAVPQQRVAEALRAQGPAPGRRVDAATAAEVGKALGARWAVTGTFADFYGKFRLNARLVDTRNGQILAVVSNDDPKLQDRAQLSAIVQAVADKLAAAAGLPARSAGGGPPPVPTDAITFYSRGLLHEARGDRPGAAAFYRQAVGASPGFDEARAGLERVGR
jgi:TolB-like protein